MTKKGIPTASEDLGMIAIAHNYWGLDFVNF